MAGCKNLQFLNKTKPPYTFYKYISILIYVNFAMMN